ncbi:Glycosyltransferase involved in cell wall bisynthesis [Methylocella tundrae]|uniref:Glycosyltransferase involved in cell wall bisynthesis n=1 Tax=Methylocella tundrae TaxID=227605 RepID=A0A8B6M4P3_METTU|nr:Glycosyltransferase involved in cell wall bisynthesis [Methylocella tundrae]
MDRVLTSSGKPERIVICALQTYSKIGGLQNFNRRAFQALAERAQLRGQPNPAALLSGDEPASITPIPGIEFIPVKDSLIFLSKAVWRGAREADILILCHVRLAIIAPVVRLLRPKLPILMFVHGIEVWTRPQLPNWHYFDPWFLPAVTRVASVSAFTGATMSRVFKIPAGKFRLLPNAVDLLPEPPGPRKLEGATILCVSRLSARDRKKNVDQVIRAIAKLKDLIPSLRFEIVGDGKLRAELETLAKDLGVFDKVTFLGQVEDEELNAAYARATVFAMPSSKEGFGIVYLEAWLRGLPVICSSEGASSEVVSDGVDGFVVDPDDVSMIADRLHRLLTQPELAKAMGENGLQKVRRNYLDANFRANLNAILDELVDEGTPRAPAPCEVGNA